MFETPPSPPKGRRPGTSNSPRAGIAAEQCQSSRAVPGVVPRPLAGSNRPGRRELTALKTLTAQAGAVLTADAATIKTNEQLTLSGATVAAIGATLSAGGKAELSASTGAAALNNAIVLAGDTVQVTAVGIGASSAAIGAVNNVTLNAGSGDLTAPNLLVQSHSGGIRLSGANVNVTGSIAAGATPSTGLLAGQAIAIPATRRRGPLRSSAHRRRRHRNRSPRRCHEQRRPHHRWRPDRYCRCVPE